MPTATPASGVGSSFGTAFESSWGAYLAPTRWLPVDSAEIKRADKTFTSTSLRGGELVAEGTDRVRTDSEATGSVKLPVFYKGLLPLLATTFGSQTTGAPTVLSSAAYQSVNAWQSTSGQSLSLTQLIPDLNTGTLHDWIVPGAKVTQLDLSCARTTPLLATFAIDAADRYEKLTGIPTATNPTGVPFFTWRDMTVSVGAYGSEVSQAGIEKVDLSFKRQLDTARFNAGQYSASGLGYTVKSEQIDQNKSDLSGVLATEYLNDTLMTFYENQTPFSLIVSFTSLTYINAGATPTNPYSATVALPYCIFDADQPTVTGPALVKPAMSFHAYVPVGAGYSGQNAATLTVVTTDTAF